MILDLPAGFTVVTDTPHYPKASIVEAIFDIQTVLPKIPSKNNFAKVVKEVAGNKYLEWFFLEFKNIEFAQGDSKLNVKSNADWVGCEFKVTEQGQVVRIRKDGLSFRQLNPYTSYEKLIPELERLWVNYCRELSPKVNLRFINKVQLPEGTKISELSQFVKVVPHVELPVEADIQNLLSCVHIVEQGTKNNAHVSFLSV